MSTIFDCQCSEEVGDTLHHVAPGLSVLAQLYNHEGGWMDRMTPALLSGIDVIRMWIRNIVNTHKLENLQNIENIDIHAIAIKWADPLAFNRMSPTRPQGPNELISPQDVDADLRPLLSGRTQSLIPWMQG